MKRILLFVVLLTTLLSSCGDDEVTRDPEALGYLYYPLEVGNYWIFNVTENKYTRNVITQKTMYQSRERIDAIINDQTGKEWFRVELSKRASTNDTWTINGVKLISRSSTDLRIQENNQTTVHMVYPIRNEYSFISNAFKNEDHEKPVHFTYRNLGEALTEGSTTYDKTLTIIREDFDKLLDLDEKIEVLAWGIGPVKRSTFLYEYCNSETEGNCEVGVDYIVTGTNKFEVLESSGKTE